MGRSFVRIQRILRIISPVLLVASTLSTVLLAVSSPAAAASSAILPGFNSTTYGGNDDGSYPCTSTSSGVPTGCTPTTVALPFTPNFFGGSYGGIFLNNNGNLTFGQPLATYTPYPLSTLGPPIIAPFFADVDTRTGNAVTFGNGTVGGHNAFGVNWPGVGCFNENTSVLDNFQVVLIDRSDVAPGDFDIEFNYGSIQWDSGQASGGGANCQGGTAARAGFAGGSGATGTYYEIPGSGVDGAFLDSNSSTGLFNGHYNSTQAGRYVYQFRNGQPLTVSGAPAYAVGQGSGIAAVHNTTCSQGPPVNCASGDFWHTFTDLSIPGRGPALGVNRTYNSQSAGTSSMFGYGWSSSYGTHLTQNSDGSVTVTEEDGSQVIGEPSGAGTYAMPAWADSTLVHNADGTWTFARRATQIFTFSSVGQLVAKKDLNGYSTNLVYNSAGQLSTVTDSSGRTLTFAYGTNGLLTSVTDPSNRAVQYAYDANGNLTSVTDPMGRVTSFTYDTNHLLLTMTNPRGGTVTNVYDSSNRVTQQTDPMGRITSFAYSGNNFSASGGTTTITNPHNIVTTEQYTSGELMVLTRAQGSSSPAATSYAYDPNTLGRTAITDPNGHTRYFTYDSAGNQTSSTDALGAATTSTFNGFNEPLSINDPLGIVTSYTYDAKGNLLTKTITGAGGSPVETTTLTYGDSTHPGDVTQVSDPAGRVTNFVYDTNGDVTSTTTHPSSGVNDTTQATYDILGRVVCTASPNAVAAGVNCPAAGQPGIANTTTYVYDADSEVTSLTDPLGHVTTTAYDTNGNVTSLTDPLGNVTKTLYDADNRVTSVTQGYGTAAASTTAHAYDLVPGTGACSSSVSAATYCTTATDPNARVTVDYFDAKDELIAETQPASGTTTSTYDPAGNLATRTTPSGVATYGYDADNRLSSTTYSSPGTGFLVAPNVTYTYNADGQRTQMTDGTGTTNYAYDSLDRLSSTTNGTGATVADAYNLDNQLTTLTYPNGKTVTSGYDNAGNVTAVTDWLGHTTNYAYDANSNISNEALANGVSAASTYDNSNQVSKISDAPTPHLNKPFATFTYTRNSDGQILTSVSSGMPGMQNQSYTYDPLSRLTSSASGSYSYDAAGNLTSQPSVANQEYNSSGQLCLSGSTSGSCSTVPTSDTRYSYSAAGQRNLTTPPGISSTTMSYNQAGELSSLNVAATTSTSDTLSGGGYQTLSLKTDGTVWAWGDNSYGDLGNGTTTNSSTPVQVPGLSSMTAVAGGGYHSVALKSDGTVWTWGDNAEGQLGNGSTTNSSTPVQVTGLNSVTALAAGDSHTLALRSDGTVWAWGDNVQGQLGNGTMTNSSTPVQVSGLSNVVAIAGGAFHSVALKADGTVWTWGDNAYGQLGNGSTTNSPIPVQVSGLTNVVQIANGDKYFGEALKSDGTVWTWGDNNHGELGNGNHTASSVPIKVSGLSNITEVSGGYEHSVVLKSDGTVWSWGENSQGDLGNATTTDSSVPVQAQGIASAIAVSAGIYHSVALKSDGTVWAWGANQSGQLGNNSFNNSLVPVSSQMTNVGSPKSSATSTLQVTYSYDGEGLRMSKTLNGTPESFAWSTVTPGGVPELLVDGTSNYVYGPDGLPLEQISSSGTVLYYLHDQLGSTSAITNSSGSVVASYTYNSFGTLAATSGSLPSSDTNPFGFSGAYVDAESGLLYLINRYYDPVVGQFISVDPLVSITGQPYEYVDGNPVNMVDPLGLCSWYNAVCGVQHHWRGVVTGVGIVAGVAAAATGVGAIVEGATAAGFLLGGGSLALGVGASVLDYGSCVNGHNSAACVGLGLGATGAFAGAFGAAGAGLVLAGILGEDSLTAAILQGIGAFGWNVGVAGTVLDATTGIASGDTLSVCNPGP